MQYSRTPLAITTAIALIIAPLIGWAFKFLSLGWMIVIILMGPIVLLVIGYVLQIVIAGQGFFSGKDLFGAARKRATIAAWVTSISVILLGIVMPDGGDMWWGSTLQMWLGAYGPNADAVHAATDGLSDVLAVIVVLVWLASFVWLVIEWIAALVRRSRSRKLVTA